MTPRTTCEAFKYSSAATNAAAADHVIYRIRKTLRLLAVLPRLGRPGAVASTFEKVVPHLPYLIVYRIDIGDGADELVVLRVYHGAQDR